MSALLSPKVCLLLVSTLVVAVPWLLWRLPAVRRVAPLAVVQILVGVALGPSLLGQVAPAWHAFLFARPVLAALDGVAILGVLLYVFCTALHLDVPILRQDARRLGAVALGSVAVPLGFGLLAGAWMLVAIPGAAGPSGSAAGFIIAVAICIAVTALPVLAAILGEMGILGTRIGQVALALAALNDAALWIMLALLLAWAGAGSGGLAGLALAGAWFALLLAGIRPLLRRLLAASEQAVLVACVALAILSAAVSEGLGTGYLIGAFAAGVVVPAACRPALVARLEQVTAIVLLPFFFMSTGLKALIEPGSASFLALLAACVGATVAGKLIGTAIPARRAGFSWSESLQLGAMMQTKGLMEVVVLVTLHEAGLLGTRIFSGMVAMAIVCTVLTAPVVAALRRPAARTPALTAGPAAP